MINKIEERLKLIETEIDDQSTENLLDADGWVLICHFVLFSNKKLITSIDTKSPHTQYQWTAAGKKKKTAKVRVNCMLLLEAMKKEEKISAKYHI